MDIAARCARSPPDPRSGPRARGRVWLHLMKISLKFISDSQKKIDEPPKVAQMAENGAEFSSPAALEPEQSDSHHGRRKLSRL